MDPTQRDQLLDHLLESIDNEALLIFCGAGLSMPPPSSVPSAAKTAEIIHRRQLDLDPGFEPSADDLESLARHFLERGTLTRTFIQRLVPWEKFRAQPNEGHRTIADLACCRAVHRVVTTNFDPLIEEAGLELGQRDMEPCILQEEINLPRRYSPIVKMHGCGVRNRQHTLWCHEQMELEPFDTSLPNFAQWLGSELPGRDLLFLGFWSDWSYLNDVLEQQVVNFDPRLVILVDPAPRDVLMAKAPNLWKWGSKASRFEVVEESAEAFLTSLRHQFSLRFLKSLLRQSEDTIHRLADGPSRSSDADEWEHLSSIGVAELYNLRRDLTGKLRSQAVSTKNPRLEDRPAGAALGLLLRSGASLENGQIVRSDKTFRVISTSGSLLSQAQDHFAADVGPTDDADFVIAAGAIEDGGVPSDIIRSGTASSVVRPQSTGEWLTLEVLRKFLSGEQDALS